MHEIITLQFGQQANYIGSHYWNVQESYFTYAGQDDSPVNHDVSFRPGIGADGSETYTPRTLIYDLKGAFGTLMRENALYDLQRQENPAAGQWVGSIVPLLLPPNPPSAYQQALDAATTLPTLTANSVRFWSDYSHVFYHPRSIVQLNDYELHSSLMPFEKWQTGEALFADLDREHDLLDRDLRPFLEECDHSQGIQVFSGTDDAWGGFANKYLERLADELGKGCRWIFGLQDNQRASRERQALQLANVAQSLHAINSSVTMHIPLGSIPRSLPTYVSLQGASPWCTSALQSAAIESLTLPTRLRSIESARASFDHLESILNGNGMRRVAACSLSVDRPERLQEKAQPNGHHDPRMMNRVNGEDCTVEEINPEDIDLSPEYLGMQQITSARVRRRTHLFGKIESLRGPWKTGTELQESSERLHDRLSANKPRVSLHQSTLLFPVLSSYPAIFRLPERPAKLAINASLSTSTAIAERFGAFEDLARRLVGVDDREALCDGLATIAEEYEEGWNSDKESDDDE